MHFLSFSCFSECIYVKKMGTVNLDNQSKLFVHTEEIYGISKHKLKKLRNEQIHHYLKMHFYGYHLGVFNFLSIKVKNNKYVVNMLLILTGKLNLIRGKYK